MFVVTNIRLVKDPETMCYQCQWEYHGHTHTGPWHKSRRRAMILAAAYWAD